MKNLNNHKTLLETSQRVAHIGSWEFNLVEKTLFWTEEIYHIFEIDLDDTPSYESFLHRIHA
ncbi:MAG: PAS domain S-box protein, partial [Campylobacterota bacterium]|nr:PAS domain S-box protein [Campylobacterota bacterium]